MQRMDCRGIEYEQIPLGKSRDLTGKRYGMLVCLFRVKPNKNIKYRDSFWLCQCDCGNKVVTTAHTLNKCDALSCGCYHKQRVSETSLKNEIGNKYGYLTVTSTAPHINGRAYWMCKCECGNTTVVSGEALRSGNTQSCGCYQRQAVSEACLKDEIGNKYGRLLVIDKAESIRYSNGSVYSQWKCLCDCGNIATVKGINLRTGSTVSCGCLVSKGEALIKKILNENCIQYIPQYSINDCLSNKGYPLRFDFAIIQNNNLLCLLEYQGIQHYEPTLWENPMENDMIKREYCQKNNIKLIEIPYWDYKKINFDYLFDKIYN
jgi:hypothetical protein